MSLSNDGKHLHCDQPGCAAVTRAPIGLRQMLSPGIGDTPSATPAAACDWLFVDGAAGTQHFCPRCAARYLLSGALAPARPDSFLFRGD